MIIACGVTLNTHEEAHTPTHQIKNTSYDFSVSFGAFFYSSLAVLFLWICAAWGVGGRVWPTVSKAFDHGGGMKALPRTITPAIIQAVPQKQQHRMKRTAVYTPALTGRSPSSLSAATVLPGASNHSDCRFSQRLSSWLPL